MNMKMMASMWMRIKDKDDGKLALREGLGGEDHRAIGYLQL